MGVASPDEMADVFRQRFNDQDAAGLLSLYADDAVFTTDGERLARGREEIRGVLERMLASPMQLKGRYESVLTAGDVAVCRLRWELLNADGWIELDGVSLEVLKRGSDGLWRFAVDDTTGTSRVAGD